MNTFESVIDQVRKEKPELFHPRALDDDQNGTLEVSPFEMPIENDVRELRNEPLNQDGYYEKNERIFPSDSFPDDIWEELEPETGALEESEEARKQRLPYGERPRQVGFELLAVYLPFHIYPRGAWGILFFENNLLRFCKRLTPKFLRFQYSPSTTLKMLTYAIARHEFTHYINELKILELELLKGGQLYIPYSSSVYKTTYANVDCIEETIANVWAWDNGVMRFPVDLQRTWRSVIRLTPAVAYSKGADYDSVTVRPLEDRLLAQSNYCAVHPKIIAPVWGSLPRPYVQPWTRYENVQFMMTRSAGGTIASALNAGPIRKTIKVFHI